MANTERFHLMNSTEGHDAESRALIKKGFKDLVNNRKEHTVDTVSMYKTANEGAALGALAGGAVGGVGGAELTSLFTDSATGKIIGAIVGAGLGGYAGYNVGKDADQFNQTEGTTDYRKNRKRNMALAMGLTGGALGYGATRYVFGKNRATSAIVGALTGAGGAYLGYNSGAEDTTKGVKPPMGGDTKELTETEQKAIDKVTANNLAQIFYTNDSDTNDKVTYIVVNGKVFKTPGVGVTTDAKGNPISYRQWNGKTYRSADGSDPAWLKNAEFIRYIDSDGTITAEANPQYEIKYVTAKDSKTGEDLKYSQVVDKETGKIIGVEDSTIDASGLGSHILEMVNTDDGSKVLSLKKQYAIKDGKLIDNKTGAVIGVQDNTIDPNTIKPYVTKYRELAHLYDKETGEYIGDKIMSEEDAQKTMLEYNMKRMNPTLSINPGGRGKKNRMYLSELMGTAPILKYMTPSGQGMTLEAEGFSKITPDEYIKAGADEAERGRRRTFVENMRKLGIKEKDMPLGYKDDWTYTEAGLAAADVLGPTIGLIGAYQGLTKGKGLRDMINAVNYKHVPDYGIDPVIQHTTTDTTGAVKNNGELLAKLIGPSETAKFMKNNKSVTDDDIRNRAIKYLTSRGMPEAQAGMLWDNAIDNMDNSKVSDAAAEITSRLRVVQADRAVAFYNVLTSTKNSQIAHIDKNNYTVRTKNLDNGKIYFRYVYDDNTKSWTQYECSVSPTRILKKTKLNPSDSAALDLATGRVKLGVSFSGEPITPEQYIRREARRGTKFDPLLNTDNMYRHNNKNYMYDTATKRLKLVEPDGTVRDVTDEPEHAKARAEISGQARHRYDNSVHNALSQARYRATDFVRGAAKPLAIPGATALISYLINQWANK